MPVSWLGRSLCGESPSPLRSGLLPALFVACAATMAGAQSLTNLGVLQDDHHFAQGLAISGNGRVVVGDSAVDFFEQARGFRWTRTGGMQDIGNLPNAVNTFAMAVNTDGSAIAGACYGERETAFRWTADGGIQDLGTLPNAMYGAAANGISGDGRKVAGTSSTPDGQSHAFLWTQGQGMRDLGVLPGGTYTFGQAISNDGSAVTGLGDATDTEHAFRWTRSRGIQPLPSVNPGEPSGGFAINANGQIVVGYSGSNAALWRGNSVHDLGTLPGGTFSVAYSVSGTGQLVGGASENADGAFVAVIWTQPTGMVDLNTYLPTLGIDLTGWQLEVVAGISGDGSTLTGIGTYNGEGRGWVLVLDDDCHHTDNNHGNHGHAGGGRGRR